MNQDEAPAQTTSSGRTGAMARLAIMAVLAIVVVAGTFRSATGDAASVVDDVVAADSTTVPELSVDTQAVPAVSEAPLADVLPTAPPLVPDEAAALDETYDGIDVLDGGFVVGTGTTIVTTPAVAAPAVVPTTEDTTCVLPEDDATATATGTATTPVATEPVDNLFYQDSFSDARPEWKPLSGSWTIDEAGRYTQSDTAGYDFITEFVQPLPSEYRVSVDVTAIEGALGAGFVVAKPLPGTRNGATLIDFTNEGRFLRWGEYAQDTGQYTYVGGVAMPASFDPSSSHRLSIDVRGSRTAVLIDDVEVGRFAALPEGQLGLVTSVSSAGFDNFTIQDLTSADQ